MLRQTIILLLFVSACALSAQKKTPSANPCTVSQQTQYEMDVCTGNKFKNADAHLNRVYHKAVQYMTDELTQAQKEGNEQWIKSTQLEMDSFRQIERAWLSYRDLQCKAAGQLYEGGSMRPMIESMCLTDLTEHRITDIKNIYENGDRKLD